MIGIVIVTHSQLGAEFITAAEFILGSKPEGVVSVSIDLKENAADLRKKIAEKGHQKFLKHFTWESRIEDFITHI